VTMLIWLVVLLMSAGTLAFVLSPLFRFGKGSARPTTALLAAHHRVTALSKTEGVDDLSELELRRENLYTRLRDMRYDLETGKLAKTDYVIDRQQLIHQAAAILARMDALRSSERLGTTDAEIEQAIMGLRRIGSYGAEEKLAE